MTRTTHHRDRDHFGSDFDTNIVLDATIGATAAGSTVKVALQDIWAQPGNVQFVIGGGAGAITTGIKGDIELPFAGVITAVRLLADQTGSLVVDIWKQTYASYPATVTQTITASAKPTLSSALKSQDTTLTGWTTAFAAGDILRINVDSAATVTRVTLALRVRRS